MRIKIKQASELPRELDTQDVESWELIPGKPGRLMMRSGDVVTVAAEHAGYTLEMLRENASAMPKEAPAAKV